MPNINDIMSYEQDEMTDEEVVSFFQGMIDAGTVWRLQGSYGRMARYLIDMGECHEAH